MGVRLHRGGRTRAWLGELFGGDATLGDRVWRRGLHLAGLLVLLVFVLPSNTFGPIPVRWMLVFALAGVLVLETARLTGRIDLPTIRPHEQRRVASYAYYAVALTASVLVFPEPVAVVAVVGAALTDPLLGELRVRGVSRGRAGAAGIAVYAALAFGVLVTVADVPAGWALALALLGGAACVSVEGPTSWIPLDDDFTTVLLPGLIVALAAWWGPGGWGL